MENILSEMLFQLFLFSASKYSGATVKHVFLIFPPEVNDCYRNVKVLGRGWGDFHKEPKKPYEKEKVASPTPWDSP